MDENIRNDIVSHPNSERFQKHFFTQSIEQKNQHSHSNTQDTQRTYWEKYPPESPLCELDDGIPSRVARLKALGNAIVPQCSQWIGEQIWKSGILQGKEYV